MNFTVLVEDSPSPFGLSAEHGFSLYIETDKYKALVDTGASSLVTENAEKLGIDLSVLDFIFITHGHDDHGGGMTAVSDIAKNAVFYLNKNADNDYFANRFGRTDNIRIPKNAFLLPNVKYLDGDVRLNDTFSVFTNGKGRRSWPVGNRNLFKSGPDGLIPDDFIHEQHLVVHNGDQLILISGCAHGGILNILDRFREIYHRDPDMVIGGFHMLKRSGYDASDVESIQNTARELAAMKTVFHSGHCTTEEGFSILRPIMKNLREIHPGTRIDCPSV